MSKLYRLRKDLILPPAKDKQYFKGNIVSIDNLGVDEKFLSDNPEWFEPIPDTPEQTTKEGFVWTEKLVASLAQDLVRPVSIGDKKWVDLEIEKFKASKQSLSKNKYDNNLKDAHKWTKMPYGESLSNTPKEEGGCKSDSGSCVNSNVCQELDRCMYLEREKSKEEQPTKGRIEVGEFKDEGFDYSGKNNYSFRTSDFVPEEKFPLIKRCIEYVLNGEAKEYWRLVDELLPGQLKYTQEQLDRAIEDAFNAARTLESGGVITWYLGKGLKFNTIRDYSSANKINK